MPTVDIGTLRARVALDTNQYVAAIGESEAETDRLRAVVARLRPEMRRLENAIEAGEDETGELAVELSRLRKEYAQTSGELVQSREATRRLNREMRNAERQTRRTGREFRQAGRQVDTFRTRMSNLVGALRGLQPVLLFNMLSGAVRNFAQQGEQALGFLGELDAAARRIAVDPTRFQALATVMARVGVDAEVAAVGINELGIRISDFEVLGSGTFPDVLAVLGDINTEGRDLLDVAVEIADRTRELSAAQRAFVLDAAFGGEFAERLNLALGTLSGGLAEAIPQMEEANNITSSMVREAGELDRELQQLNATLEVQSAAFLAPYGDNIVRATTAWRQFRFELSGLFLTPFAPGPEEELEALIDDADRFGISVGNAREVLEQIRISPGVFDAERLQTLIATIAPQVEARRREEEQTARFVEQQAAAYARASQSIDRMIGALRELPTPEVSVLADDFTAIGLTLEELGENPFPFAQHVQDAADSFEAIDDEVADVTNALSAADLVARQFADRLIDGFSDALLNARSFNDVLGEIVRTLGRIAVRGFLTRALSSIGVGGGPATAGAPTTLNFNIQGSPDVASLTAAIQGQVVPIVQSALSQSAASPAFRRAVRSG